MKKMGIIALCMGMILSLAGCGNSELSKDETVTVTSCEQALNQVWEAMDEDEKFPVIGGSFSSPVEQGAGTLDLKDTDFLTYNLYLPSERVAQIDDAASMIHGMNANMFTASAFHASEKDVDAIVDGLKDQILNTQWICGMPDLFYVYVVNDAYIVSVFGNVEFVEDFHEEFMDVYESGAQIRVEESLS